MPGVSLAPATDADLFERVRHDDARAFEELFRRHYDRLCRAIATYLGDRDDVEDAVQSAFSALWQARHTLEPIDDARAYLLAAVRRRAVDMLRREEVRRRAAPLLTLETAPAPSPLETFEADTLRHRFARAISALPARTREAFLLSRRDGLSYEEISLRMGISIKTVGVHIGNSLATLRKVIGTK
jgi:RNA polymerase sigma-70 factor, ECF subfamily